MGCGSSTAKQAKYVNDGSGDVPPYPPRGVSYPPSTKQQTKMTPASDTIARSGSAKFKLIKDRFETLDQVIAGLRSAGMEATNMALFIDFTRSNEWNGDLHGTTTVRADGMRLPYLRVAYSIINVLSKLDNDSNIPCFGFGDSKTTDVSVGEMKTSRGTEPTNYDDFEDAYNLYLKSHPLSGPTSFTPAVNKVMDLCKMTYNESTARYKHHTCVIITDGATTTVKQDIETIRKASNYPISIVIIGIGTGMTPDKDEYKLMKSFDDEIQDRKFDNLQFNVFPLDEPDTIKKAARETAETLMEIPDQYIACRTLGYIG